MVIDEQDSCGILRIGQDFLVGSLRISVIVEEPPLFLQEFFGS